MRAATAAAVAVAATALVLLASAGPAAAGDSMLPVLLEEARLAEEQRRALGLDDEPVQGTQALPPPVAGSNVSFGVALLAAAAASIGALWWTGRRNGASA